MISIILPYYNSLKQMRDRTLEYFEMIESFIHYNPDAIQLIISDYGSNDDIKEIADAYKFDYVYTEPNEGQFFNISKCNNNAFQYTKGEVIFTNSIDWRYTYDFFLSIEPHFKKLGDIILELPIVILKKDNTFHQHIHIPIFLKKHIILAGGWDERIYNWGQDDRDVMQSLLYCFDVLKYSFTHKNFSIYHLWHEPVFYNEHGAKEQNKRNIEILIQNVNEKRANIINSYWKVTRK